MLCDSSNLHKQKLVKPKPLASKMAAVKRVGQKNGEVGLLVEYLFCGTAETINTQPEVRLRVGPFDVGVLVFSAAAIFLASVHGKCFRYTEDIDVVFTYLLCG